VAQGDADLLEGVVSLQGIDSLLAGGRDFTSGDLEFDFARNQHGGDDVARRVRGPAERVAAEIVEQTLAIDRATLVDVVTDADHRLVVSLKRGTPSHSLHEAERVKGAADGGRVGDLQEFLSSVGAGA